MNKNIKTSNSIVFIILFAFNISITACSSSPINNNISQKNNDSSYKYVNEELEKLIVYADKAKKYIAAHNYANNICFLIDMSISSGKNRFFVYDINKDSILLSGLVAHGACGDFFSADPTFSNVSNSKCSSLGRYKIGGKYSGNYGTAYKLYGLDETNSNAFNRVIVLHGYGCVPDEEPYPLPVCNSLGCPMVSYNFLKKLSGYIDKSNKPILLWMFK